MPVAKAALFVFLVAYPAIVYFGLDRLDARTTALVIVALALIRIFCVKNVGPVNGATMLPRYAFFLLVGSLIAIAGWVAISSSAYLLLFYPVMVNVLLFAIFAVSLIWPPTVVERIARLQTPQLPERGVRYTRRVTMVWCLFFVVNGSLALFTALNANMKVWAVYNSVISYGLMGLLFAGEYLIRRRVQRNVDGLASGGWS